MKIQHQPRRQQLGSVLVITIILLAIIGTSLASYLMLSSAQAKSVARSQNWNCSLDMAEAGIEEALEQMNTSPNDFSANSWGGGTGGIFGPTVRSLANGAYFVVIQTNPVNAIYATGYVAAPMGNGLVSRAIRVTTLQLPLFNVAFAAQSSIDMNGNGAATDSFNSSLSTLSNSNNPGYYDPTLTSTNGSVASDDGIVNIGNHTIVGSLYLGPEASYTSDTGQVTGTIFYDYNVQIPPVEIPAGPWIGAPGGANHTFTMAENGGYFLISDSKDIIIQPGVKVTLKVTTSNFDPTDITIQGGHTNSGTLVMYQVSGSMDLSGNSIVGGAKPENFIYYGASGVTSITLAGTTVFIGCIYAPTANLTNNGGGSGVGFIGSCIVGSIDMNGHYDFHYDEALGSLPLYRGHVPSSWQEL